jgi:hypothetical protein
LDKQFKAGKTLGNTEHKSESTNEECSLSAANAASDGATQLPS